MDKDIMVSICCLTYNHKSYISKAIESFLSQKTNFKFEIIIHDDCSTDGTIKILNEYEKNYPDIVRVVYEKENQYSKGVKIEPILFKKVLGKYIAICEGDDYWCDDNKLQIQYDFMEQNDDYSLIFHDASLYMEDIQKFQKRKTNATKDGIVNIKDLILGTGIGGSFPTCSMFFRSKFIKTLPSFFINSSVGDMPLNLYLGIQGKVFYMHKIMGVYRCNVPGSWSIRIKNKTNEEVIKSQNNFDDMMRGFNKYSNYKYDNFVSLYLLRNEFELNVYFKKYNVLKDKKYKKLYSIATFREKIRYFLLRKLPFIFIMLKDLKNAIRH